MLLALAIAYIAANWVYSRLTFTNGWYSSSESSDDQSIQVP